MQKMGKAPTKFAVKHLNPTEVLKEKYRQDELYRLNVWRAGKIRGGAYNPSNSYDNVLVANLDEDSQDDQSWIDSGTHIWEYKLLTELTELVNNAKFKFTVFSSRIQSRTES
ncbi:hypothetical protein F4778DRAFT_781635 [Xylariomycetidae sp. FL2044]|nr:hypothetical protein F4778DRAFT_781635 [Xylariomycetidae sp. FL2044]